MAMKSKAFFSLPVEEKSAIPNERNANPQRGWSYVGSENTSKLDMLENDGLEDEKVLPHPAAQEQMGGEEGSTDLISRRNTLTTALPPTPSSPASGLPSQASPATANTWKACWRSAIS